MTLPPTPVHTSRRMLPLAVHGPVGTTNELQPVPLLRTEMPKV